MNKKIMAIAGAITMSTLTYAQVKPAILLTLRWNRKSSKFSLR